GEVKAQSMTIGCQGLMSFLLRQQKEAVLGVAVWFNRSLDPINPETFERIKNGMTREEVEATIGKPPDGPATKSGVFLGRDLRPPPAAEHCWYGKSSEICVRFNHDGKATKRYFIRRLDAKPSIPTASAPGLRDDDVRWEP